MFGYSLLQVKGRAKGERLDLLLAIARTGKMPIPLIANFSCGVGVSPAPEFDEKDFCKRFIPFPLPQEWNADLVCKESQYCQE